MPKRGRNKFQTRDGMLFSILRKLSFKNIFLQNDSKLSIISSNFGTFSKDENGQIPSRKSEFCKTMRLPIQLFQ